MPSVDSHQAAHGGLAGSPRCGIEESFGIPLQSLEAAEAGQAGIEAVSPSTKAAQGGREASQARTEGAAPNMTAEEETSRLAFDKLFTAARLQTLDDAYRAARIQPEALSVVSLHKAQLVYKCYKRVCAAWQSRDDEAVPQLLNELADKVVSQLDLIHKVQVVEGLSSLCHRDHDYLERCLGTQDGVEDEWSNETGEWKKYKRIPKVEHWARSVTVSFRGSWLGSLLKVDEVEISPGKFGDRVYTKGLVRVISLVIILGAGITFGTPIVVLATEAFPKHVNISILVLSVLVFFGFLVWWLSGQDSDHMLMYLLAYTAVLGNINVGGK